MDIAEIVNHAGYDSNTVDNDFALLRMANKVSNKQTNKQGHKLISMLSPRINVVTLTISV